MALSYDTDATRFNPKHFVDIPIVKSVWIWTNGTLTKTPQAPPEHLIDTTSQTSCFWVAWVAESESLGQFKVTIINLDLEFKKKSNSDIIILE